MWYGWVDVVDGFSRHTSSPDLTEGFAFEATCHYRLIRRLGRGGASEVWLADRTTLGGHRHPVAVKVHHRLTTAGPLANEPQRMAQLAHDNVVPFIDSGRLPDGRSFVAMAYVDGIDLHELSRRVGMTAAAAAGRAIAHRIPDPIVGIIVFMVLRALRHAHTRLFDDGTRGLVHRDVSPSNILLEGAEGFVKLTDFGAASPLGDLGLEAMFVGKVPYAAPEAFGGEPVDGRTDIYSLGVVAYELLTGFNPNLPHPRPPTVVAAMNRVLESMELPLVAPHEVVEGVDPELSRIVATMLASSPEQRYGSAAHALTDVAGWLYGDGFGPTTESLSAYMAHVDDPGREPGGRDRVVLRFLADDDGRLRLRPPWELTETAAADVAAGRHPTREGYGDG